MKKKIALILAFTLLAPVMMGLSHSAKAYNDLAIGDPMGRDGGTYHHHRHHKKKATTTTAPSTETGTMKEPAKPAPEKTPEKAPAPEPAK